MLQTLLSQHFDDVAFQILNYSKYHASNLVTHGEYSIQHLCITVDPFKQLPILILYGIEWG